MVLKYSHLSGSDQQRLATHLQGNQTSFETWKPPPDAVVLFKNPFKKNDPQRSDEERARLARIKGRVEQLAAGFALNEKRLEQLAKNYETNSRINMVSLAQQYFSDEEPEIAEKAIQLILQTYWGEKRYKEIVKQHRDAMYGERKETGFYQTPEYRAGASKGGKAKKGGLTSQEWAEKTGIRELLREQEKELWTDDHVSTLRRLLEDQQFYHQSGQHKGKPDTEKIAQALNAEFGTKRTTESISQLFKRWRKQE